MFWLLAQLSEHGNTIHMTLPFSGVFFQRLAKAMVTESTTAYLGFLAAGGCAQKDPLWNLVSRSCVRDFLCTQKVFTVLVRAFGFAGIIWH